MCVKFVSNMNCAKILVTFYTNNCECSKELPVFYAMWEIP